MADRRTDFVEWARRARLKPTFDREDRDYRLAVASAARALIDAAVDGGELRERANALQRNLLAMDEGPLSLVPPGQAKRLVDWAEADEQGLARALRDFSAERDNPDARLASFVAAIERETGADQSAGGITIASLLNFATSPETLPLVDVERYGRLQELLGEDPILRRSPVETYRACLAFAGKVERLLSAAGVPVRDMVDVESLITTCSIEAGIWAGEGDASGTRRDSEPSIYLAVAALIRNTARYLVEWLEFHRLVGVERFYLYDNESEDGTREALAAYVDEGIVVLRDWPGSVDGDPRNLNTLQGTAYMDCIRTHGAEARWIAIIDQDEFLFSPTGELLPSLLVGYERWPAVAVNMASFGTAGHITPSPGLVIENYTKTIDKERAGGFRERIAPGAFSRRVKNIVDPLAVAKFHTPHSFSFTRGIAVDENGYPLRMGLTRSRSFERLRVNHYFAKSEDEVRAKLPRRTDNQRDDVEAAVRWVSSGVRDETILRYLPALREALARRPGARTGATASG
jgi:hypothetical protein